MNKCITCGANCEKEYCFRHKPKKSIPKMSSFFIKKLNIKKDKTLKMKQLFLTIWKKRPHRSEVSGTYLGNEPLTIFFHHILPKRNYPLLEFDEENIILLTFEEHQNVEADELKYEEINKRREFLLTIFEII